MAKAIYGKPVKARILTGSPNAYSFGGEMGEYQILGF